MARTDRTARIAGSVARAAGAPALPEVLAGLDGSALGSELVCKVYAPGWRGGAGGRHFGAPGGDRG